MQNETTDQVSEKRWTVQKNSPEKKEQKHKYANHLKEVF